MQPPFNVAVLTTARLLKNWNESCLYTQRPPLIGGCAPFLGQAVHTGRKPHAVFQGGDARQRTSRADVPPTVRPDKEKGVGPAL